GDVVVAIAIVGRGEATGMSGLGAHWELAVTFPGGSVATQEATRTMWVGTGAGSSGAVTVASTDSRTGLLVFLVRGTDGSVADAGATISIGPSGTRSEVSPAHTVGAGQVALAFADIYRTENISA